MSDKRAHLFLAARVAMETAPWHALGAWFCARCDRECGVNTEDMCACCRALFLRYEAVAAAGGEQP